MYRIYAKSSFKRLQFAIVVFPDHTHYLWSATIKLRNVDWLYTSNQAVSVFKAKNSKMYNDNRNIICPIYYNKVAELKPEVYSLQLHLKCLHA